METIKLIFRQFGKDVINLAISGELRNNAI